MTEKKPAFVGKELRAYSIIEKAQNNTDERIIRGMATTPAVDRVGDIVDPLGAEFAKEIPLLWQHTHKESIGTVRLGSPSEDGIPFEATIPHVEEDGKFKEMVDQAWHSVKYKAVRAVSIGFRVLEDGYEILRDGTYRFFKYEIFELSLVSIPANQEALITEFKGLREAGNFKAADEVVRSLVAPVRTDETKEGKRSGEAVRKSVKIKDKEEITMSEKTLQERIDDAKATVAAKKTEMKEISKKADEEGRTFDAEEAKLYDEALAEAKSLKEHIKRLEAQQELDAETAEPVGDIKTVKAGAESRQGIITNVKRNLPVGTSFVRYTMALAKAKGDLMLAKSMVSANKNWHDTPEVLNVIKAAVDSGTTTDPTWAEPLVDYQTMASEFIEFLRPQTVLGRIENLRRVPFNIEMSSQTSGSTANWVGEAKAKPVSSLGFGRVNLGHYKAAGIVVFTDELLRFSNPSVEGLVRQDLAAAIIGLLDTDFLNPAKAEVAGVSPASVTNGVTATVASGTTNDDLKTDVKALFQNYIDGNLSLGGAVWVMPSAVALSISMIQNALGQYEYPDMTMNGGTFFGIPAITSEYAPAGQITLIKAPEVFLADDNEIMIDVSREASLIMDTDPEAVKANAGVTPFNHRSLWQHNEVGVRVERYINWQKRRAEAVQLITGAAYA